MYLFTIYIYNRYKMTDPTIIQLIQNIKELFLAQVNNSQTLGQLIDTYLIPHHIEKKTNAEVSTPHLLRKDMLDKIPNEFWTNIKRVFEPCAGKGGFLLDIIDRFMIGLTPLIPNDKKRYKTIVEQCLYWSDINSTNVFICKLLLDPNNEYKLNYNEGNTLDLDVKDKWNITGFDAVIGNPPYNSPGNTGTGNTIWQHFVKMAINDWLVHGGILCFVHPPGWRKPNTTKGKLYGLYDLMAKTNQMTYLSIHGIKDGQQTFKCGTRYDWYVMEKTTRHKNTIIIDETSQQCEINLGDLSWLPNSNISNITDLLATNDNEHCPIMYSSNAYEYRQKWMSKTQTQEFKYPCVHSTPKRGIRYMYSSVNDRGHFGYSKVIFGDSGIYNPVIDMEGTHGMTKHSMAIQVDTLEEAEYVCKAITSRKFYDIIQSCSYSSYAIDWNIFKYFKKDFWKEFI